MKRILILVEGQTEERFVKDLLAPHLSELGAYPIPTVLVTKRVKDGPNFKGGVSSCARLLDDLRRLVGGSGGGALVTTLVDLYGFPADIPGLPISNTLHGAARAREISQRVAGALGSPGNLIPFLTVHEFEALILSDGASVAAAALTPAAAPALSNLTATYSSPEEINERPGFNPAARIIGEIPHYQKLLHGVNAAKRIGLDTISARCPHFRQWLGDLEKFARS